MFTILNIFLSSVLAHACADQVENIDKYTFQKLKLGDKCTLSIWPRAVNTTRRKIQLNDNGLVMITVDKSGGSSGNNTGAHSYHIVPATKEPTIVDKSYFRDASGMEWQVRGNEWKPDACQVEVVNPPSVENKAGYQIEKCDDRFVIDSGFLRGGDPIQQRDRTSQIIGPSGKKCMVKNSKIFEYSGKDAKFKLQSATELKSFLRLIPACADLLDSFQQQDAEDAKKPTT